MKYKVDDLVYFNDNHQNGVGKIVSVVEETETTYLTYLVHSTQIVMGHESYGENAQDNTNNWWFREAELKPFWKKVGQKYKVIRNVEEYAGISIGDIITLISIEDDNLSYYESENVPSLLMYDIDQRNCEVEFYADAEEEEIEEETGDVFKYKIGDLVYFDDDEQKGVGKVVVDDDGYDVLTYLVYSTQIVDGHDGKGYVEKQDNDNNWYFFEDDLKPFIEKVGQKYKVLRDENNYFDVGEIVSLVGVEPGANVNLYENSMNDMEPGLLYHLGSLKPEVEFFEEDSIIVDSDTQEVPLERPFPMAKKATKEEKPVGKTYINGKEVSKEVYDTIAELFLDEGEDEGIVKEVVLSKTPPTPGKTALEGAGYTRVPFADDESWAAKTYTVGFSNGLAKVTMPIDSSIYISLGELQAIAMRLDETIDEGEANEN